MISALQKQREENLEFQASLVYIMRPSLKKKKERKKKRLRYKERLWPVLSIHHNLCSLYH
jgi:hypothetical protein